MDHTTDTDEERCPFCNCPLAWRPLSDACPIADEHGDEAPSFDMNEVVELLHSSWNLPAYVEHTGGGVQTIYAGEPTTADDGYPRYPVLAGPGWRENGLPRASSDDFYVGPDDDGETDPLTVRSNTPEVIAALIAGVAFGMERGKVSSP